MQSHPAENFRIRWWVSWCSEWQNRKKNDDVITLSSTNLGRLPSSGFLKFLILFRLAAAMDDFAKNRLILASAGSGKTFQLGNRLIDLVVRGVAPEKIVALTFTRKAAGEFADSVLGKLAQAASEPAAAARLRSDLKAPNADFLEALERVVIALPRLTLGTMDSFFSKVVRAFQYELGITGGKFDLLEGPRAEVAANDLLTTILSETLERADGEAFLHAFRRAVIGKESQGVLADLRRFVQSWHGRYRAGQTLEWGPAWLAAVDFAEWEKQKTTLAAQVTRGLSGIEYTDKRQRAALEKLLAIMVNHTIGSGSLSASGALFESVILAVASSSGPMLLSHYKQFRFDGPAADALRNLISLAASCEMAAALSRTRAIREVIAAFDQLAEKTLRRRGLLGFEDVKVLMGQWATSEDARLGREAIDFRLGARYEHWLLDEFQDTSQMDWLGLLPLVDEAAGEGDGTTFIVGDKKQAIYAWRGGEVGLFDEVMSRYEGRLAVESLDESWRSCPQVLSLVNQVCGDQKTLAALFGAAAEKWQWQDHQPAAFLQSAAKSGEARVEWIDGKWEDCMSRCCELLGELQVGKRAMTCGVLVRSNSHVQAMADQLRAQGFDVIEEGQRAPAKDHPVGIAIHHLLSWLADPSDQFAWEVLQMSPLAAALKPHPDATWQEQWEFLLELVAQRGFAGMISQVLEAWQQIGSDFGKRRADELIMALASLDAQGGTTAREAAAWVERLRISQTPGVAAVQVMTIHKSKGLGFDLVVLPDVPNDAVPSAKFFEVAEGPGWITAPPPQWARALLPELAEAEASWGAKQRYENACLLYVALTRAKRGLYVLLELPADAQAADKPSLANWLATAIDAEKAAGIAYQEGSPAWIENVPSLLYVPSIRHHHSLVPAILKRVKVNPSASKAPASFASPNAGGRDFGNQVHRVLETLAWMDETAFQFPKNAVGSRLAEIFAAQEIKSIFERRGREIELFREQAIDAQLDGEWLSGVIDRLHLHRDPAGAVCLVEIIDFKTDAVSAMSELVERYGEQMAAYQRAMQVAYPAAKVVCLLVSTHRADSIVVS
jgi:ATP-dependent helicase/nuclease subunit A